MESKIEVNPNIHFGKPCVAGTRITVEQVLELINEGISFNEIINHYYPNLTEDDIHACMKYAIDLISSEEIHIHSVSI